MALAITKKQKRERDSILKAIDNYSKLKNKEGVENPCEATGSQKYLSTKKACKTLDKIMASKTELESKKGQAELDKQTSELMKGAVADSATTANTAAGTAATATTPQTPQATDDMTKYLAIGGVGLLLVGGVAYFLLRTPSSSATAPAK